MIEIFKNQQWQIQCNCWYWNTTDNKAWFDYYGGLIFKFKRLGTIIEGGVTLAVSSTKGEVRYKFNNASEEIEVNIAALFSSSTDLIQGENALIASIGANEVHFLFKVMTLASYPKLLVYNPIQPPLLIRKLRNVTSYIVTAEALDRYSPSQGVWQSYANGGGIVNNLSYEYRNEYNTTNLFRTRTSYKLFSWEVIGLADCIENYVQLEWVSVYSGRKSWVFEIDGTILKITKKTDLQPIIGEFIGESIKCPSVSIKAAQRAANYFVQSYLADLFIASNIKMHVVSSAGVTKTFNKVKVQTDSAELTNAISQQSKDITFNIEVFNFSNN